MCLVGQRVFYFCLFVVCFLWWWLLFVDFCARFIVCLFDLAKVYSVTVVSKICYVVVIKRGNFVDVFVFGVGCFKDV